MKSNLPVKEISLTPVSSLSEPVAHNYPQPDLMSRVQSESPKHFIINARAKRRMYISSGHVKYRSLNRKFVSVTGMTCLSVLEDAPVGTGCQQGLSASTSCHTSVPGIGK